MFFVPKDYSLLNSFYKTVSICDIFHLKSVGVVTARDKFCIDNDYNALNNRIKDFTNKDKTNNSIKVKYNLKDTSTFKLDKSRKRLIKEEDLKKYLKKVNYRPFDERHLFYNKNIVERPIKKHEPSFDKEFRLMCSKAGDFNEYHHAFITNKIFESGLVSNNTGEICYGFPLYLINEETNQGLISSDKSQKSNLADIVIDQIAFYSGLTYNENKLNVKIHFHLSIF